MIQELLADIAGVNWWVAGPVSVFCAASLLFVGWLAFAGGHKPSASYSGKSADDKERLLHAMRLGQFRLMLRNAKHDDDVMDAMDWAYYALGLHFHEIERELDGMHPLGFSHDQAALSVRREQFLRVVG